MPRPDLQTDTKLDRAPEDVGRLQAEPDRDDRRRGGGDHRADLDLRRRGSPPTIPWSRTPSSACPVPCSADHWLGTDDFGRDVFSRIIYGSRVSLIIGTASVLAGLLAGTGLGMVAGFFRGKVETAIMRAIDVLMCFPDLILAIAVTAALGSSLFNLIVTIGIVMTPRFARLAHGQVLSITENEYVIAARAVGVKTPRILWRHIFPNIFGDLLVAGTLWVGVAIRLEANLAFIGLGISPPTPTWGNMIREGIDVMINAPWISMYSGLSILITILAFNMLGDGIRDISDPRLRGA